MGQTIVCCINGVFFTPKQANSECAASLTCDCARIKLWHSRVASTLDSLDSWAIRFYSLLPLYLSFCVQELVAFCERTVVGVQLQW
jgi:hypothetical protein